MDIFSRHYAIVEKAIGFLIAHKNDQPSLQQIAEHVQLSPFHFQRIFHEWAGISPTQFLQALTLQHAKLLLQHPTATLFEVTLQLGLSSTSRLHDLFIKFEAMSPAEYKNGARGLSIVYNYYESLFGKLLIANTHKGICYMSFYEEKESEKMNFRKQFPNAEIRQASTELQKIAFEIVNGKLSTDVLPIHIKGTAFQIKIWEALLKIPEGRVTSYGTLAKELRIPKASRAIGTAIGSNPIAFLIPCHRVIQQSGALGGYRWGIQRKAAIIAKETAANSV